MRNILASLICLSLLLTACGGGGSAISGSGSGTGTGTTAYNVTNAIVDQGPAALTAANTAAVNIMYVKVTVCAPGSVTTCQTIDHVQVDTGSQGVRLLASVLNSTMLSALQPVALSGGGSLAECTQFVDGFSWGPIVTADVHVGGSDTATSGESAPGLPIQVIGTTTYAVPNSCLNVGGTAENTVVSFGANGIIGVGLFDQDCGDGCSQIVSNGLYYSCTSSAGCAETTVPLTSQVLNPVFKLAANGGVTDNNGVIIEMPSVASSGAATVTGTLVFGIGTQANNALSAGATVLTTDPNTGLVSTSFLGQTYSNSYLDSGSNAIYFNDSSIPVCTQSSNAQGFFCPASTEAFATTVTGVNGRTATANFSIGDASTLFNSNQTFAAFSNLGGPAGTTGSGPQTFALGLPFYFGVPVYTAMEQTNAGGTEGPYFAF